MWVRILLGLLVLALLVTVVLLFRLHPRKSQRSAEALSGDPVEVADPRRGVMSGHSDPSGRTTVPRCAQLMWPLTSALSSGPGPQVARWGSPPTPRRTQGSEKSGRRRRADPC